MTVAGLEIYGARPFAESALRADIGEIAYRLVIELEALLRRHDIDLAAKHWAIYAERGRTVAARRVPVLPERVSRRSGAGAYDVQYDAYDGPVEVRAGTVVDASVQLTNRSWHVWDSLAVDNPVFLSYHWLDGRGATAIEDGRRSPLPRPLATGDTCRAAIRIECPDAPGRYTLAIDLVHERVTWFSGAGAAPMRIPIRVVP